MSLELILGCMQSGKSTELIRRVRVLNSIGRSVILINHSLEDNSYLKEGEVNDMENEATGGTVVGDFGGEVRTHANESHTALAIRSLATLFQNPRLLEQDIYAINEGQFFGDLKEGVLRLVEEYGKRVIVCGLDGDYRRQTFGSLLDLIPYADSYEKYTAMCAVCMDGSPGLFSGRIAAPVGAGQVAVNGEAQQKPMCRKCYLEHATREK